MSEQVFDELAGSLIATEAAQVLPTEEAAMMRQLKNLIKDDDVTQLLKKNDRMKKLLPALSHLLRTSNITNDRQLKEMKINWRIACRYELLIMAKRDPTEDKPDMAEYYAWLNFGYAAIEDMRKGWRGKLYAERTRTFRIESVQPRRKRFGLF